jgi:hypothetical protein
MHLADQRIYSGKTSNTQILELQRNKQESPFKNLNSNEMNKTFQSGASTNKSR